MQITSSCKNINGFKNRLQFYANVFVFYSDFGVKYDPDIFLTGLMRFTHIACEYWVTVE